MHAKCNFIAFASLSYVCENHVLNFYECIDLINISTLLCKAMILEGHTRTILLNSKNLMEIIGSSSRKMTNSADFQKLLDLHSDVKWQEWKTFFYVFFICENLLTQRTRICYVVLKYPQFDFLPNHLEQSLFINSKKIIDAQNDQ